MGNSDVQHLCEQNAKCAGLHFDGHACRMLRCSDVRERVYDKITPDGRGGCTQRLVARATPHATASALLDSMNDKGCAANAFVARHLRSQIEIPFNGTPSRYFTILDSGGGGGRTWLVWKDNVIDGHLKFALLTGVDATEPSLARGDNQTLIGFYLYPQNRTRLLTHNTAFMVLDATLHAIGGRHNRLYKYKEDGVYRMNISLSDLDKAVQSESAPSDRQFSWSTPTKIFDGHHLGCVDGRGNRDGVAPFVEHGVCEFDGRNAAVFFRGRYYLYARANPTLGRRFVQFTTSNDLQTWSPFRSIRLEGVDACAVNIYTFAAQAHPLRSDRLIAFYPAVFGCHSVSGIREGPVTSYASDVVCNSQSENLSTYSLAMSCSADGRSWSQPFLLFSCYGRVGQRTASLPVANGVRFTGDRFFVWVHQDMPSGLRKDMTAREMRRSKLVRYELDGAAFRKWSADECGAALTAASESEQEVLRPKPFKSSSLMKSIARLWYDSRGDGDASTAKELLNASRGWCGSTIPLAPWARVTTPAGNEARASTRADGFQTDGDMEPSNDDFWFDTRWANGVPARLHGRISIHRNESGMAVRVLCKQDQGGWCHKKDANALSHACCRH